MIAFASDFKPTDATARLSRIPGDCFRLALAYHLLLRVDTGGIEPGNASAIISKLSRGSNGARNSEVFRRVRDFIKTKDSSRLNLKLLEQAGSKSGCSDCENCGAEMCPKAGRKSATRDAELLTTVA